MSFNIKNESKVCQLHHRSKHNNNVNVVCELSEKIGSPQFENGEWMVPSDVVGLNGKKPKVVKLRFHPSVSHMSSGDAALHQAACQSALKVCFPVANKIIQYCFQYLDLLLEESVWTRKSDQEDQLFGKQLDKIVELLVEMDKVLEIDVSKVGLTFLHNELFDEFVKLISCKSISSHLHTVISEDDAHQSAEIIFEKDGRSRKLISLDFDAGYLKSSESGLDCVFEVTKSCFTWVLPRVDEDEDNSPPNVSQKLDCFIWVDGIKLDMPVYSPCATVFHYLDKLTSSLASLSACPTSPNANGVLQKVSNTLVSEAIVGLDKSEAPHLHKFILNITQAPLMITTDFDHESLDIYSDSETKLTISPTDSVDSGVSLSSPTRQCSFDDDDDDGDDELSATSPVMRSRSRSESCSSLKGILKWPRRAAPISRFGVKPHLMRSYSECHHDDAAYHPVMPFRFSEDDEDAFHEEDDDSSDCCVLPAAPRKKSVSFSERIEQTRLFNSNTSIESQRRKNLKKTEKKKKRENSLASSIESIHEEVAGRVSPGTRHQTV
ncbi:Protein CBG11483 [Caenorhabditis briggsae]|uniref:Protein CBG11483 n=1 Tax=Caenorhabditis briggsae TaxID=6238 RepID=A8XCW7_CAEBR|nr:Protein CBG11483 [Caenorhabditis briggsae]CAP30485.2 Protein CBG11483 [Caenorhabditis briggsae]